MRGAVVLALLAGLAPGLVEACSCNREPRIEYIRANFTHSDAIFLGEVVSLARKDPAPSGDSMERLFRSRSFRFRPQGFLKGGPVGHPLEVWTGQGLGDCGVGFEPGGWYVVFAFRDDLGRLMTDSCTMTAPAASYLVLAGTLALPLLVAVVLLRALVRRARHELPRGSP